MPFYVDGLQSPRITETLRNAYRLLEEIGLPVSSMTGLDFTPPAVVVYPADWLAPVTDGNVLWISDEYFFGPGLAKGLLFLCDRGEFNAQMPESVPRQALRLAQQFLMDKGKGWDNPEDVANLLRISGMLFRNRSARMDVEWLGVCEQVHLFATTQVTNEQGERMMLWEYAGYDSWSQFVRDFLGMQDSTASLMRAVWITYRMRLKWTEEEMLQVGKSKLALGVGTLRKMLEDGAPESEVKGFLDEVRSLSFSSLEDSIRARKAGEGKPVNIYFFQTGQADYERATQWTDKRLATLSDLYVTLDGERFNVSLLLDPDLRQEDAETVLATVCRRLRVKEPE